MAIIPQIRCSRFGEAFEFYTQILDFEVPSKGITRRARETPHSVFSPEKETKYSSAISTAALAL